jgi:hypothetical protein
MVLNHGQVFWNFTLPGQGVKTAQEVIFIIMSTSNAQKVISG